MSEPTQTAQPTAVQVIEQAVKALPEIDLLARVAEALAYRGIEPASDVEKLRVTAGNIRAVLDLDPLAAAQSMELVVAALEQATRDLHYELLRDANSAHRGPHETCHGPSCVEYRGVLDALCPA